MSRTIQSGDDAAAWHEKHGPLAAKEGEAAPDFTLHDPKGENPVTLSQFQGETPVALVFGSFT